VSEEFFDKFLEVTLVAMIVGIVILCGAITYEFYNRFIVVEEAVDEAVE